jgi:hypothetical protein
LTANTVARAKDFPADRCERVRAEFGRGHGELEALAPGATTVRIDEITAVIKRERVFGGSIEIRSARDGHRVLPLTLAVAEKKDRHALFAALALRLGPAWGCHASRSYRLCRDCWTLFGMGIFVTAVLALFTLIAFNLVSNYAGTPWPLVVLGFVVLPLLIGLFAYLKMHRILAIPLVVLLGLLGSVIGQIGCIILGTALAILGWVWIGRMMVEVETVTRLTPKTDGIVPGQEPRPVR